MSLLTDAIYLFNGRRSRSPSIVRNLRSSPFIKYFAVSLLCTHVRVFVLSRLITIIALSVICFCKSLYIIIIHATHVQPVSDLFFFVPGGIINVDLAVQFGSSLTMVEQVYLVRRCSKSD